MRYHEDPRDAEQLAELLELAGSAEALLDAVDELEMLKGRRPHLVEVVNLLMDRRHDDVLVASSSERFAF